MSRVHGKEQVVHMDTTIVRDLENWVRGTNSLLPADIVVLWAKVVPETFHARFLRKVVVMNILFIMHRYAVRFMRACQLGIDSL